MNESFLAKTLLFRGTTPEEIRKMIGCLQAEEKSYKKGEHIYQAGDTVQCLGLVLSGGVHMEHDDLWGNRSILGHAAPGQIFAETYACVPGEPLMVNVVAAAPSEILFLNTGDLLMTCSNSCSCHNKIIANLLFMTAQKNLQLSRRILHTSPKSIRGRLLSYFSFVASSQGSYAITIPFNRQQLADYLNVDRSALSNELSKMQKDGLLTFSGNQFHLSQQIEDY